VPELDPKTLIIIAAITLIITSGAILISSIINRHVAGAKQWALGYMLIATGVILQTTQQYIHPIFSIVLMNQLITAGCYLAWMGARIFQRKSPLPLRYFIIVQLILLLMFTLIGLEGSGFTNRVVLMSAVIALLSALTARELITNYNKKNIATTITGITFALLAIVFIARGISIEIFPERGNMLTAGKAPVITYFITLIFNILITFGFIIMLTERLENRLQQLADTDFLTGLDSRRAIVNSAERLISRGQYENSNTALLMMDLDKFKQVNDTYGHLAGDAVLCHFAKTMRQCLRPNDLIGRMGGEEFVAILANSSFSDTTAAAERLRAAFESEPTQFNDQLIDTTVSIGISATEDGADNFDQLFKEADHALYHAKRTGRNRIASHSDTAKIKTEESIS